MRGLSLQKSVFEAQHDVSLGQSGEVLLQVARNVTRLRRYSCSPPDWFPESKVAEGNSENAGVEPLAHRHGVAGEAFMIYEVVCKLLKWVK